MFYYYHHHQPAAKYAKYVLLSEVSKPDLVCRVVYCQCRRRSKSKVYYHKNKA